MIENNNRIEDENVAHEIANLEIPARDREKHLKELEEGGFEDDTQRTNIAICEAMQPKYPDAFRVHIDSRGRKILELEELFDRSEVVLMTERGVIGIYIEGRGAGTYENIDFDLITDDVDTISKNSHNASMPDAYSKLTALESEKPVQTRFFNLGDSRCKDKEYLRTLLIKSQEIGSKRKQMEQRLAKNRAASTIIEEL